MKKGITVMYFILIALTHNAQHYFNKQWDYRFGGFNKESLGGFEETKAGGFILGGSSTCGISGDKTQENWDSTLVTNDYWILKVDSAGHKEWDMRYGGTKSDALYELKQSINGDYFLDGVSSSRISGDKTEDNWDTIGAPSSDIWVVRTDSAGNMKWDKRIGTTDFDLTYCIATTKDGGAIVGGRTDAGISGDKTQDNRGGGNGTNDYWVIKLDSSGNIEWDKRFGGNSHDGLTSVVQADDGGYVLAGYSASGANGDKTQSSYGFGDYWVVKIDSAGNKIWDKDYGSDSDDSFDEMIKTRDGGYLLGGFGGGGSGSFTDALCGADYHIVKIDSAGTQLWDKAHGGGTGNGGLGVDYLQSLFETSDGGFLIGGYSTAPATCEKTEDNTESILPWIVKTDSIGNKEWDKTIFLNSPTGLTRAIQTSDGCYVIALATSAGVGGYKSQPNWDASDSTGDYWIMKFCMDTVSDLSPALSEGEGVVQVWPNPFRDDLNLSLTLPEGEGTAAREAKFTITDAMGSVIYEREENNLATNYTKVLDLSWVAKGVYFVTVTSSNSSEGGELCRVTKRVVKE